MKDNERHAGRYTQERYAEEYAAYLRMDKSYTVEVRPATVYDVIVTDWPTGVHL